MYELELTEEEHGLRREFLDFARAEVAPLAARGDAERRLARELLERVSELTGDLSMVGCGLLMYALGQAWASLASVVTAHAMATLALRRWSSLPAPPGLAAFALTEPGAGSDAAAISCAAVVDGDHYVLDGEKRWISGGQLADVLLVFAVTDRGPAGFAVPADAPGLTRRPSPPTLGLRAAMLADVTFDGCRVPANRLVGRPGTGISHVAGMALTHGRYCVAWASLGIADAALRATITYARQRRQFGVELASHQLVQRLVTEAITRVESAQLNCLRAGRRHDGGDPDALRYTLLAKYVASEAAVFASNVAVQVHGAHGLSEELAVERYFRDARVMQIIEGSDELMQTLIARYAFTLRDD